MIPLKDNIPSYKKPIVTYLIIFLNGGVFVYQNFLLSPYEIRQFIYNFGFVPEKFITEFFSCWWTIFTSMFLHGGLLHFLGNMWFLHIFGDNVEDRFGHLKYILVYIVCGVCGNLLQFVLNPKSSIPMIGASGAISGVLGAYFIFYPSAGILTLIPLGFFSRIVVLPSIIFLGLWFLFQFFSGTTSLAMQSVIGREIGGIAYWAHIGGFLAGIFFSLKNQRKRRIKTYWHY